MNQNHMTMTPPMPPGLEPWTFPPGPTPAWYGWPPPPPSPPETPGGVRKLTYSVEEAAEALGVSRSLVCRLIHQWGFPSAKLQGRRLISAELLVEWMRQQAGGGSIQG